jgi:IS5 family transposase
LSSGAAPARLLREEGAWFGKTSKGWFLGFKLHVLRHMDGRIVNLVLTPGNWDYRAPVLALLEGVEGGVALGDLGYRGKQRAEEWSEETGMLVLTRADAPEKSIYWLKCDKESRPHFPSCGTSSWTVSSPVPGVACGTPSN